MPFIFKWEGEKYENDPDDPGGETKFGIDKRSHSDVDIKNLTKEQALAIYYQEYWVKFSCEWYAYPLGEVFFNSCVNNGPGRAKKILIDATVIPDAPIVHEAKQFCDGQANFYYRLVAQKPTLKKFLKGWLNRTNDLRKWLKL